MALNLSSTDDLELICSLQRNYRELLDANTVEIIPESEQAALNLLIDSLISANDRVLIISSEVLNLRCSFRYVIEHFETNYCHQPYNSLDLKRLESAVKDFKPEVIIFDQLSFFEDPDWSCLRHLTRINGSSLVVKAGEYFDPEVIEESDFVTAQWGNGMIISKRANQDFLEESRNNFFSPFFQINKKVVDYSQARSNAEALFSTLIFKTKKKRGSVVQFSYEENSKRVEDFIDIIQQIGIKAQESNFNFGNLKTINISTFQLTHMKLELETFRQLGMIISKAYEFQRDIKKLEQLREQVLNIERKI